MADNLDQIKDTLKKTEEKLRYQTDEVESWKEQCSTLKAYNAVLKKAVKNLKSEESIEKYKELGTFYRAQFLDAVEPFTLALFTRVLGYSADEAKIVIARVKRDLVNPKLHMYVHFHFVWGRKATEPRASEG